MTDLTDQVTLSEVKLTVWDMYRFIEWAIWWRFGWLWTITAVPAVWFAQSRFFDSGQWSWSWWKVGALVLFAFVPSVFFVVPYFALRNHVKRTPTSGSLTRTPSQRQESTF